MGLYTFYQQSPNQTFYINETVTLVMVIEADDENDALERALNYSVYMEPILEQNQSLECKKRGLGPRWRRPILQTFPALIGYTTYNDYMSFYQKMANDIKKNGTQTGGKPEIRIFFKNGTITEIYGQ